MRPAAHEQAAASIKGWVLYDGHCGLCSAGARRLRRPLHALGYEMAPLQSPWVLPRLGSPAFDPQEMALLTRDGRLFSGLDAYLHLAESTEWAKPLAWLARIGWIDRLLRWAYRFVADRRHRVSTACQFRPDLPKGSKP